MSADLSFLSDYIFILTAWFLRFSFASFRFSLFDWIVDNLLTLQ
jgi:hypothetical protein